MRVAAILAASAAALASGSAGADGFEIAAGLGYAAPLGSAERGARVSDTTLGQIPFALDAGYRLTPRVGVVARGQYGVAIPTLCATASDCKSSLGGDGSLALGVRVFVPKVGLLEPIADAGVGYEWLTTRLADGGARSTRAYRGPVPLWLQVSAAVRVGKRWTIGPTLGASVGRFTSYALATDARSPSGPIPERAWHGWLSAGARVGLSL